MFRALKPMIIYMEVFDCEHSQSFITSNLRYIDTIQCSHIDNQCFPKTNLFHRDIPSLFLLNGSGIILA